MEIVISSNRTPFKKKAVLSLSILTCALLSGLTLFHLFIPDVYFAFLGFFIFAGLFIGYSVSLIQSIRVIKLHKKPLLINLLTPVVILLIIGLNLPIYINFYILYPGRSRIVEKLSKSDSPKNHMDTSRSILYLEGLETDYPDGTLYVYFKTKEEFLLSGDLPYDTTAAHEGFEYSENCVFKESGQKAWGIVPLGEKWRYVRYERRYHLPSA